MPHSETDYPKTKRARERLFERIIDAGRAGKSHAQIAEMIGISCRTLESRIAEHADLARAMAIADDYALAWWEALSQKQAETREGNSSVLIFIMKNRFGEDYAKDSSGEDVPAEPSPMGDALAGLTPETRRALRELLRGEENEERTRPFVAVDHPIETLPRLRPASETQQSPKISATCPAIDPEILPEHHETRSAE